MPTGPLVLLVCAVGVVLAVLLGRGVHRQERAAKDFRRSIAWFVLAVLWTAGGRAAGSLGSAEQSWYRDGQVGLLMGLVLLLLQILGVVALAMGGGRLLGGVVRLRRRGATTPQAPGPGRAEGADPTDSRVASLDDPRSARPSASWVAALVLVGLGAATMCVFVTVRGWAGDDLIVLAGKAVLPGTVNALVPTGIGVALLGCWLLTLRAPFSRGVFRTPLGAELAGVLSVGAVLLGAVLDLVLLSSGHVLTFPAEEEATCDVLVEQRAFLFTGSVDVLVRPHESMLASTVLSGSRIGLEEIFPFQDGGEHEIRWDGTGATLTFDASDNPGPLEVVRVDCP